jgi:hypothetical protein
MFKTRLGIIQRHIHIVSLLFILSSKLRRTLHPRPRPQTQKPAPSLS